MCGKMASPLGRCVALTLMAAGVGQGATVELADRARVTAPEILLGDLGEIRGTAEEVAALRAVVVGPAPLPAGTRRLSVGYLKLRVRRSGLDCATISFTGAPQVLVSSPPAAPPASATHRGAPADSAGRARVGTPPAATVPRRSTVRLVLDWGAVRIVADATTLQAAPVGALVPLRLTQTGETVTARLIGPGEAIITRPEDGARP